MRLCVPAPLLLNIKIGVQEKGFFLFSPPPGRRRRGWGGSQTTKPPNLLRKIRNDSELTQVWVVLSEKEQSVWVDHCLRHAVGMGGMQLGLDGGEDAENHYDDASDCDAGEPAGTPPFHLRRETHD